MNNENRPPQSNEAGSAKYTKAFYIRLAIIYAIAIILIILAINFDSFENPVSRIFSVITPVFYGAVIAYLCNPFYVFFQGKALAKVKSIKWRKLLSILLTYILVFLIIFALVFIVVQETIISVQAFVMNIDTYIANAEKFIVDFINNLSFIKSEAELKGESTTAPPAPTPSPEVSDQPLDTNLPEQSEHVSNPLDEYTSDYSSDNTDNTVETTPVPPKDTDPSINIFDFSFTKEGIIKAIHDFLSNSGNFINQIGNSILRLGTSTISNVLNVFLGFVLSVYMISEKDLLIAKAKKTVYAFYKKEKADNICNFSRYADDKVGHFIKGKLIESIIVGTMAYVFFLIFGIPSALMIAIVVAIMNIIPVFGPFLGAVPAALLVLIMDPSKTIAYIIIVVIIMQINGNYISPRIVGNRTGLTPFGAIVALILMSGYFGIIGMFLGIPICAIIVEVLWAKANQRLKENNMSTELAEYYPDNALIEDSKKHKNITAAVVDSTVAIFCKIFKSNKKCKKCNNENQASTQENNKKD